MLHPKGITHVLDGSFGLVVKLARGRHGCIHTVREPTLEAVAIFFGANAVLRCVRDIFDNGWAIVSVVVLSEQERSTATTGVNGRMGAGVKREKRSQRVNGR